MVEPLLPVVSTETVRVVLTDNRPGAKAVKMPPSAEDYVWTYTETGEHGLRPVVVTVGVGDRMKR